MAINETAIISSVVSDLIRRSFNSIMSGAAQNIRSAWTKVFEDFEPFMIEVYNRNSNVRILCQKDSDVKFEDIYVQSDFKCGNTVAIDNKLMEDIISGENIIVIGNGGSGKTFFMRNFWLTLFKGDTQFTPIFVELRHLGELTSVNIETFIRRTITRQRDIDEAIFSYFCSRGRFVFLLDGFDEVPRAQRDTLQSQILRMAAQYPSCRFVVSSRSDRRFAGWQGFKAYDAMPFKLSQVKDLITKVPFNPEAKQLFTNRLNEEFYKNHRTFLSNPLLAIMMMMTFKENMDIPRKMSSFYDQVYNTLYQWHDATKAFNRPKSLGIVELRRSFGVFCLLSYYKQIHEFSKTELSDFIEISHRICGINCGIEETISDYEEAVNLIKQDGLNYVFIHRSFQEYFAAYALISVVPHKFISFLPALQSRTNDNVIGMCFEMQRHFVVENFITPAFKDLQKRKKTFFGKGSSSFDAFKKYGVRYTLYFDVYAGRSTSKQSRINFSGIGSRYDDSGDLLENLYKLKSDKPPNIFGYTSNVLVDSDIIGAFNRGNTNLGHNAEVEVEISFEDEEILYKIANVDTLSINDASLRAIDAYINGKLIDNRQAFVDTNNKFEEFISDISRWCKNEMLENKNRSMALDDVVGR